MGKRTLMEIEDPANIERNAYEQQVEEEGLDVDYEYDSTETNENRKTKRVKKSPIKRFRLGHVEYTVSCEWNMCSSTFSKVEHLLTHLTEHINAGLDMPTEEGFVCFWQDCSFVSEDHEGLVRHIYFHGFHTKLKALGALYMERTNLKCSFTTEDQNLVPEIPEDFQCMWNDCDRLFVCAQSFYWHIQCHLNEYELDNPEDKYLCLWKDCNVSKACKHVLTNHCRSHTQEKMIGCPTCGTVYSNNSKFGDHCRRQLPELNQFQCSHCKRKFQTERFLRDHVRHHINSFKCNLCEMTCFSKSLLRQHIHYRHTDLKPHKCPECNKGFKRGSDMTRHLLLHSEDDPYICNFPDCKFSCRSLNTFNRHINKVHHGIKKKGYACHVCEARYTEGSQLTKHLMNVHKFHWPTGHVRFKYKEDEDGLLKLQTVRYESVEINQQMNEADQETDPLALEHDQMPTLDLDMVESESKATPKIEPYSLVSL